VNYEVAGKEPLLVCRESLCLKLAEKDVQKGDSPSIKSKVTILKITLDDGTQMQH
jgi:hypothetical protein